MNTVNAQVEKTVPPGYKRTEAGVIPVDWDVKTIDQVAFVTSGKRLPLGSSLVDLPTPHPYIRVTDMRPGTVDFSEIRYVPESVFPAIKRYCIYQADIFISVAGSLGIVGKIPPELDGANLTENANRITNITCSQDYLLYVLFSPLIQNTINSIRTVGAQPKLALTRIRKFTIPLPPLPEQRAIAEVLSDVDRLLGALEALIAKKRAIKQAAMQQLLTGHTRLPGFGEDWQTKTLSELGVFSKGRGIRRDDVTDDGVPCIRYGELYTTYGSLIREAISHIPMSVAKTAVPVKRGDLLFAGSGETRDEIGRCAAFLGDGYAYAGGDIIILTPHVDNSVFLGYLMNHRSVANQKERLAQGDAIVHIYPGTLGTVVVNLPSTAEQDAIAEVLSDMDAEIAALEARRDKTRAIKQGMMQQLLTGRVRLVEPATTSAGTAS